MHRYSFQLILLTIIFFNRFNLIYSCPIYLTISTNGVTFDESNIVINWGPNCLDKPEWIGVFNADPSVSYAKPLERILNVNHTSGKFITNIPVGQLTFPKGWNKFNDNETENQLVNYAKGKCLKFYIASFDSSNNIMTMECLKIQPNWMGLSENIGKLKLKDLFIPGTHSSGAYYDLNLNQSELVKYYGCSQKLDVWSQLVFGIRFLDFQIGYNNVSGDFWIVNENLMIAPLKSILQDIKRFALLSREVILIDFSGFPIGFQKQKKNRTSNLIKFLISELDDVAVKRSEVNLKNSFELTINDIRNVGKHLVITFPLDDLLCEDRESEIIWPSWKKFSIAKLNNAEVLNFMRLLFAHKDLTHTANKGWIFEAIKELEQTFNSKRIMQTTRQRADEINLKISNYLGGPWSMSASVVTIDFFTSTNIIDIAIYANTNKAYSYSYNDYAHFDLNN